jgi:hypothetical protein
VDKNDAQNLGGGTGPSRGRQNAPTGFTLRLFEFAQMSDEGIEVIVNRCGNSITLLPNFGDDRVIGYGHQFSVCSSH